MVAGTGLSVSDWQTKMLEQAQSPDPLDPELEAYLEDGDGYRMIRHPLVYSIFHEPVMNWRVNEQLKAKKRMLAELRDEKNWFIYVMLAYERAYRLEAFREIADELDDQAYWKLLADVWIDSENIWQNQDVWRELLTDDWRGDHVDMMDDDDRAVFDELPDKFTVYRGFKIEGCEDGFSWTMDKVRAKWFAKRWLSKGETCFLAEGTVHKSNVIAYFNERSESEIVVAPEDVCDMVVFEIEVTEEVPTV